MAKILVAVFSASGVTRQVGEAVAKACSGDFYAIEPKYRYTDADLNWRDPHSRSSVEMKDPSARPELAGPIPDPGAYDTVIIGYPIWWGLAPRIIETFLESCELSGKTILPFCTSGGSGIGQSDAQLHKNVSGNAQWAKGVQINRPNEKDIRKWLEKVL